MDSRSEAGVTIGDDIATPLLAFGESMARNDTLGREKGRGFGVCILIIGYFN